MIDLSLVQEYSHHAHDSIKHRRNYVDAPYWTHTDEVADIVRSVTDDQEDIAAAYLHDVLEDVALHNPAYDAASIERNFGSTVLHRVLGLTDVYVPAAFPTLNRAARKLKEAERLGNTDRHIQTIKLADLISNTTSIVDHAPTGFAITYLKEKDQLLSRLTRGDRSLYQRARDLCDEGLVRLGVIQGVVSRVGA